MLKRLALSAVFVLIVSFTSQGTYAQTSAADTFKTKCSMCHGDDGLGTTAMGKALGIVSYKDPTVLKLKDPELTTIIKNGKNNKMPAFNGQLTDAQIKDLLQYIHKLQK